MTALLEWISATPPTWANDEILNWEDLFKRQDGGDMLSFVIREVFESNASLDMRNVVGQRDHYAGQTWLEAVNNPQYKEGKMRDVFRKYQDNPDYYFNGEIQNGISVSSLNGGFWYSDNGGNHRTVLAKFACDSVFQRTGEYPMVVGVHKHHYFVDTEVFEYFVQMRQLEGVSIHVSVNSETRARQESAGLTVIDYNLKFHVGDYRFSKNGRAQWLDAAEFVRFAKYVLKTNASPSTTDKIKHHWREFWGDRDSLIYQN